MFFTTNFPLAAVIIMMASFARIATIALLCIAPAVFSLTIPSNLPTKDAPYTDSTQAMEAAIVCPSVFKGTKDTVILVPGTTLSGNASFPDGPYAKLLPSHGYDVCWINPPNFQMADIQVSGQYVAYAIQSIAKKSPTGKVKVLGHSQGGGLSIPQALIFYPSARRLVTSFVGEAPDFHGTTLLPYPGCVLETFASGGKGCAPAILQQEQGSMLLNAQNYYMTSEIVPTTAIYTYTDEVVIPQVGPNYSSRLPGATEAPLQKLCGPLEISDHLIIIANPAAYELALLAFEDPSGQANLSKFNPATMCFNIADSALNLNDVAAGLKYFATVGVELITSGGVYVKSEPPLKPYQCDGAINGSPRPYPSSNCGHPGPLPPIEDVTPFIQDFLPSGSKVSISANTLKTYQL